MKKLIIASNNAGKLREFSALLAPSGFTLIPQGDLAIPESPEPHPTFVENALTKARHASRLSGLPALADDSGVCVYALQGAPGVYSARYAAMHGLEKSDEANNQFLIQNLASLADKRAYYYAALVLVRSPEDPQPLIAEGVWQGEIVAQAQGEGGFGYDPHFFLPDLGRTAAQLSATEKNQYSHRAMALRNLLTKLDQL